MVQVKIAEDEKAEDQTKDDSKGAPEEQAEVNGEKEDQGEKEIPLGDMKKAELIEKVKEIQESADKNYDLFMRSVAEIENFKKRFQKEKSDLIKFSNESLIKQLLLVIDNLEKAISASQDENSVEAVREGIELTLKGLVDTLEKSGLAQVEAEGEPFDPNFHEAISEMEDNKVEPGTVIQVLQQGYTLNERLIRPAMVVISKSNA
ncbi:MAG: nucleotide exchange factor GrpE [Deltaproteobacteria bacterium]|nr:nucleotide exchange factor GrpE [Deltaproteobacteria bacterium]MBW2142975.1 nucleotide exchange factor GrpE [Deltaproteobacteria bacterium]